MGQFGRAITDNRNVDDVIIYYRVVPIDGVNNVLGRASALRLRVGGTAPGTPISGFMEFDVADVANNINNFPEIILHEMGHVLGVAGDFWTANACYSAACMVGSGATITYTCPQALAQFALLGCTTATGLNIETSTGGGGSDCTHWAEATFDTELMTPVRTKI